MNVAYQYKECGLNNIFLTNGFVVEQSSRGGTVSIENVEGLHRAIGVWLTRDKKFLDGREARFLRLEMGFSQALLARLLGKDEQAIARWEKIRLDNSKSKQIPPDGERMIRALYLESIDDGTPMKEFLQALADLEDLNILNTNFQETEHGWELAAA